MAAITDHKDRSVTDAHLMDRVRHMNVDAAAIHYEGAIVYVDASTGRGVVTSNAGANRCAGICYRAVDNTGGAITTDEPLVVETGQIEEMTLASVAALNIGDPVYGTTNADLSLVATSASYVGRMHSVAGTNLARIKINPDEVAT